VLALFHVVVKEFLQLRHDRKMIPVLVVGPLMQLLALGFAANLDVNHIPLLLVDQDKSRASRELVERFTGSGYFSLAGGVERAADVEPWLVDGRAQIALVIERGYGEAAAAGRTPHVQAIADGSDSNSAGIGLGYASRIVAEAGGALLQARLGRVARRPGAAGQISLVSRVWYNPDLKTRWFYVPAVAAMVLMLVTMVLPAMAVVREKEIGTLEQISVTPLRPWQLLVGKLVPFALIGLVDLLLIVALAKYVLGVPLRGSLLTLTLLTLLFLLNTLGLGLLASTLVGTQQQAMMFSALGLMVPMILLGGLIFPYENMPFAFQCVSYMTPVHYYAKILRGVFLKGSGFAVLWPEALILVAMGFGWLALASARFRKRLD
jgi:drug efflux transport system permease protein